MSRIYDIANEHVEAMAGSASCSALKLVCIAMIREAAGFENTGRVEGLTNTLGERCHAALLGMKRRHDGTHRGGRAHQHGVAVRLLGKATHLLRVAVQRQPDETPRPIGNPATAQRLQRPRHRQSPPRRNADPPQRRQ